MSWKLIPVRKAIIKMSETIDKMSMNNKWWREYGEKETLLCYWWECKLVQPLWRTVWRFLRQLKKELAYDPGIPIKVIYLEKTMVPKVMHPSVHCSTAYSTQDMEATQMFIDRWMDQEDMVHTHNRILLSH